MASERSSLATRGEAARLRSGEDDHPRSQADSPRRRGVEWRVGPEIGDPPAALAQRRARRRSSRGRGARRGRRPATRAARRRSPQPRARPSRRPRTTLEAKCSWATVASPSCQRLPISAIAAGITSSMTLASERPARHSSRIALASPSSNASSARRRRRACSRRIERARAAGAGGTSALRRASAAASAAATPLAVRSRIARMASSSALE